MCHLLAGSSPFYDEIVTVAAMANGLQAEML
jgi:hypothetical protein